MKEDVALPLTDVTPDQEIVAERDLGTIHTECAALHVTIP